MTASFTPTVGGIYLITYWIYGEVNAEPGWWSTGDSLTVTIEVFEPPHFDWFTTPDDLTLSAANPVNKMILLYSEVIPNSEVKDLWFEAWSAPTLPTDVNGLPDESTLPSTWTLTGADSGTKIFAYLDRTDSGTRNIRVESGTAYKEIKAIVYDAMLGVFADAGDINTLIGHGWINLTIDNNDALARISQAFKQS